MNDDIKMNKQDGARYKERVIDVAAGAIASAAGIITADLTMPEEESSVEQVEYAAAVDDGISDEESVDVSIVSSNHISSSDEIVCEVVSSDADDESEVEVLATETDIVDCDVDIIEDNIINDNDQLLANVDMDPLTEDLSMDDPYDMAYECQFDGEILV